MNNLLQNSDKYGLKMKNKKIFIWDNYSDQPQVIKDRGLKKTIRKKEFNDNLKLLFTSIFILPISIIFMKFFKGNVKTSNTDFIGLGVNLDKDDGNNIQQDLDRKSTRLNSSH